MPRPNSFRERLKGTRLVSGLRRFLYERPGRSPAAWLFKQTTVAWLYAAPVRRQLPASLRVFARFCRLQNLLWKTGAWPAQVIGGESLFGLLRGTRRLMRRPRDLRLDLDGLVVHLDPEDPRMLYVPNELRDTSTFARLGDAYLSPGDTCVDVGANHGSFSLLASRRVGPTGLVLAFEPQGHLAALLRASLAENGNSQFRVHAVACGDSNRESDIYIPRQSSGIAGVYPGFSAQFPHRRATVQMVRFDDFEEWSGLPGRLFLKMDMEGAEVAFLRGARQAIRSRRPHIMLEANPSAMRAAEVRPRDLIDELRGLGYEEFEVVSELGHRRALVDLDPDRHRDLIAIPTANHQGGPVPRAAP